MLSNRTRIGSYFARDPKYRYHSKLYPHTTLIQSALDIEHESLIAQIYTIGAEALSHLPASFCGDLFKIEEKLINADEPIPFFPELQRNAHKVDQLVKFCISHKDNLECAEIDTDDLDPIDHELEYVSPEKESTTGLRTERATNASSTMNISMQVLGGFMAVLGCAAVAVAFVVLNAATFGTAGLVVAGIGLSSALLGVGLFATGTFKNRKKPEEDESLEHAAAAAAY